jgi:hypothetical protein
MCGDLDQRDLAWRDEAQAILQYHWGSAYVIAWTGDGKWVAQRRDNRESVTADTPEELIRRIRRNYDANPVPRLLQSVPDDEEG